MMCPTCDGIGKEWFDGSDCIPCGGTGLVTPERTANDDRDEDAAEQEAAPAWTEEMARRQASSLLPWEHFERLDAAGAFRRAPERTTNDDLQEDAVERDRASDAASDALTEEQQRNREMHLTLALIHGFNEMAMKAITLGEKVYYRLSRDAAEKRFDELGGTIKRVDERPTVLVIPGHVPEIRFDERDIGLMRECVARYDREATAADQPAPASTGDDLARAEAEDCRSTIQAFRRDEEIWEGRMQGDSVAELAARFGIHRERVSQACVRVHAKMQRQEEAAIAWLNDRGFLDDASESPHPNDVRSLVDFVRDDIAQARRDGYADAVARLRERASASRPSELRFWYRDGADWLERQAKEGER